MSIVYNSEHTVFEKWTYLPKRMSSGKLVWWTTYYHVEKLVPKLFGLDFNTTLYSKEEWFIKKLSMDNEYTTKDSIDHGHQTSFIV